MSIDLKGNTNYVALKNEEGQKVVPRTALSAVDLVPGEGIRVDGDTISVSDTCVLYTVLSISTTD